MLRKTMPGLAVGAALTLASALPAQSADVI